MSKKLSKLIDKCMRLSNERLLLSAVQLAIVSPLEFKKIFGYGISKKDRAELKERCNEMGGLDEVIKKSKLLNEEYDKGLSEIAELLEEDEGFELKRFEDKLNEDQFSWLKTNIREIKKHLKGIEV